MGEQNAKCDFIKKKNSNFNNVVHSCIICCVCVAPIQVHNLAKYEGSKFNHVVSRATERN